MLFQRRSANTTNIYLMGKIFNIYADSDQVYSGNFSEIPSEHKEKISEALIEWGDILSKGGLNETIYSLLFWYNEKEFVCAQCNEKSKENKNCSSCGKPLSESFKHERNDKIDNLLNYIGMLTRLEIE